jgi:pyruvate dehydrogenase E1 component alpha subunit/2-oxoisovalerate dehydrogenase E1 component alpha subunit
VSLVELITYRRKGHAEHDNQSYVPAGEIERWAAENDPIDRYRRVLQADLGVAPAEIDAIDARIVREIDDATDLAERSGTPDAREALMGVYAEPPVEQPLWFRRDADSEAYGQERPESWGTWNADGAKP